MAQRVTVALEDDLDGGPADETVRFGFGGAEYEIYLSKKNAAAFRKMITPFIEHARKAARGPARKAARTAPAVSPVSISGPERTSRASRSARAGGSRPAWWSNTRPPLNGTDPHPHHDDHPEDTAAGNRSAPSRRPAPCLGLRDVDRTGVPHRGNCGRSRGTQRPSATGLRG